MKIRKWLECLYTFELCNCVLSNTIRSKYSNCKVNPLKYDNQEICFHYHCEAHLIHYFDQGPDAIINACDLMQNLGQIGIL